MIRVVSLAGAVTAVTAIVMGQHVTVTVSSDGTSTSVTVPDPKPVESRRPIDLVIALDTSGSMTQLIDSARAKLWDVVNELAKAKPTPFLRVGLLTYGSPNISTAARGWVVRHTDLTYDLDAVYAKMMGMRTHGGEEFVGWVLNDAVNTMSWSRDPAALKMIFVAGNESADQCSSRFNFRYVAEDARSRGILINAVYAGNHEAGVREQWEQVAMHGGGHYSSIDMRDGTIQIPAPQDKILIELNTELNATYVPYGEGGRKGKASQSRQDANAAQVGEESIASRIAAKASQLYNNLHWDLVDAVEQKQLDVADLDKKDLPPEMRTMTVDEQRTYVKRQVVRRRQIQERIRQVNGEREEFLREARAKSGVGERGLDRAMKRTVRKQAEGANFAFHD
jgi:hypothetical protein